MFFEEGFIFDKGFRGSLTLGNRLMIISDSFKASIVTISPGFIPVCFLTSLGIVT